VLFLGSSRAARQTDFPSLSLALRDVQNTGSLDRADRFHTSIGKTALPRPHRLRLGIGRTGATQCSRTVCPATTVRVRSVAPREECTCLETRNSATPSLSDIAVFVHTRDLGARCRNLDEIGGGCP
jgi:hypothetical protein